MPPNPSKPASVPTSIGRYDIVSMIAEGGMGTVWKGRCRDTERIVAIKIVPPAAAKNATLLKRFEREFAAARALDHPHIVKAIEFDARGPSPFLVMEFVDGESVGQRIERDGLIAEDEAVRIVAQVSQGLHRAHKQGLIHRDVKPDNILLTTEGNAKLTDLGLVKDAGDDYNLTRTGRGLGTPYFMAPEQFRDAKGADVRCDVYSLGATLYMMVTGVLPFGNCSALDCFMRKMRNEITAPRQVVPTLSERIDWAILRAMSADPDKRPATCREFVEDLLGRSTRPAAVERESGDADVWYLVYKDDEGETHTVKGGTEAIRRALREGFLGEAENVVACRQKQGPFVALRTYPEFRDLLVVPAALPTPGTTPSKVTPPPSSGRWPGRTTPTSGPPSGGRVPSPSERRPVPRDPSSATHRALLDVPADGSSQRLPHIPLVAGRRPTAELLMWGVVFLVALATAFAVYYLMPR